MSKAVFLAIFSTCLLLPQCALAQSAGQKADETFPSRPLRLISYSRGRGNDTLAGLVLVVGYSPGGGNDTLARLVAPHLTAAWGQNVVVDNRPGAGGTIAAKIVSREQPDGYTVLMSSLGTHGVGPSLHRNSGYDALRDFEPICLLATTPIVLVVNNSLPQVKSVQDLIKEAKAKPGAIRYASSGLGAPPHTAAAIFQMMTGTTLLHVPYKGGGSAIVGLLADETNVMFGPAATMLRQATAGRLRALAISRKTRLPEFPDLPTFAEAGLPGYEASAWFGIHAPARTPKSIVNTWNKALLNAINSASFRKRIKAIGLEAAGSTPKEFGVFVRNQIAKYAEVIKAAGMEAR